VTDALHAYCVYCGWRMRVTDSDVARSRGSQVLDASSALAPRTQAADLPAAPGSAAISHPTVFCTACGTGIPREAGVSFCLNCGEPIAGLVDSPGQSASTPPRAMIPIVRPDRGGPRLALLDDEGSVLREIRIDREQTIVGRNRGDVQFDDDEAVSPEHAMLTWRDNALVVRDLGSSNGSWLFITAPHTLSDGDTLLIGSQVIRFRRLRNRGAADADADGGVSVARVPAQNAAVLEQLRTDGSVRDVLYLSADQSVLIGREFGDWVFPYDPTVSSRHAEVRPVPDGGGDEFTVRDAGSRNGVAILVRGERAVHAGERLLFGRKMLRLELS
jgi:pSer/pThr/pTyr-binding forkhead associated (FHA) protein